MEISKNNYKVFAVAYNVFISLRETPTLGAVYADSFGVHINMIRRAACFMKKYGLISSKKGNVKDKGLFKVPGVTLEDFFLRTGISQDDRKKIEAEALSLIQNRIDEKKLCLVCEQESAVLDINGTCEECKVFDKPLFERKILAKCGHYSMNRYFKCRSCDPMTGEDDVSYKVWV